MHFSKLFFRHVFPFQKFLILNHCAVHLPAWDSFMLAGPGFDFGPFVLFAFDSCLLIVHVPLARNLVEMVSISFHLYTFLNSVFPPPKIEYIWKSSLLVMLYLVFFSSYIFFSIIGSICFWPVFVYASF